MDLSHEHVEALAATARIVDTEFRTPGRNPRLPQPIPVPVVAAWTVYYNLLKAVIAAQSPLDKHPRRRPRETALLPALQKVERAAQGDRMILSSLRFHGTLLRVALGVENDDMGAARRQP